MDKPKGFFKQNGKTKPITKRNGITKNQFNGKNSDKITMVPSHEGIGLSKRTIKNLEKMDRDRIIRETGNDKSNPRKINRFFEFMESQDSNGQDIGDKIFNAVSKLIGRNELMYEGEIWNKDDLKNDDYNKWKLENDAPDVNIDGQAEYISEYVIEEYDEVGEDNRKEYPKTKLNPLEEYDLKMKIKHYLEENVKKVEK